MEIKDLLINLENSQDEEAGPSLGLESPAPGVGESIGLADPDAPEEDVSPKPPKVKERIALMASIAENEIEGSLDPLSRVLDDASKNKDIMDTRSGEAFTRKKLSGMAAKKEVDTLREHAVDVLTQEGDAETAIEMEKLAVEREQIVDQTSLEKYAARGLVSSGIRSNETQAQVFERQGSVKALLEDNISKSLILQNRIEELSDRVEGQGISGKVFDFLGFLNPITNLRTVISDEGEGVDVAQRMINRFDSIYKLPPEEFASELDVLIEEIDSQSTMLAGLVPAGFTGQNTGNAVADMLLRRNPTKTLDAVRQFAEANAQNKFNINAFAALDAADVGITVGSLGASAFVKSSARLLKATGNRERLSDLVTAEVTAKDGVGSAFSPVQAELPLTFTDNEVATSILPQEMKITEGHIPSDTDMIIPATLDNDVSVAVEVERRIQENEELLRTIDDIQIGGRLSDQEVDKAFMETRKTLEKKFTAMPVVDFKSVRAKGTIGDNINFVDVIIGKNGGGGFASEAAAKAAATRRGFSADTATVFQDIDGQSFIRQRHPVLETGLIRPQREIVPVNQVSRFVLNPANTTSGEFRGSAILSAQQSENIQKRILGPVLNRNINKLSKRSRNKIRDVLDLSRTEQRWMSTPELMSKGLNTDEIAGYHTMRQINDLEYQLINYEEYVKHARQGAKQVSFRDPGSGAEIQIHRAREITPKAVDLENNRILDVDSGDLIIEGSTNSVDLTRRLAERGQRLFFAMDDVELPESTGPIKYFVGRADSLKDAPLSPNQINYVPGGHRIYQGKWFVKQPRIGQYADNGREYVQSPLTHVVGITKKEAKEWADNMEEARKTYNGLTKGTKEEIQAARAVIGTDEDPFIKTSLGSYERFDEAVRNGDIVASQPFEVVFDRELPPSMQKKLAESRGKVANLSEGEEQSGITQWYRTNRKNFKGKKGDHLLNPQDELAEIVDPFASADVGIRQAIRSGTYINFHTRAVEAWAERVRPFLEDGDRLNALQIFNRGLPDRTSLPLDEKVRQGLEAEKDFINRNMNRPGRSTEVARGIAQEIVNKIDSRFVNKMDITSKNPTAAMRGLIFDRFLGLFDISQMVIQPQSALAAAAIAGTDGARALPTATLLRYALTNKTPEFVAHVSKKFEKFTGLEQGEFKNLVKELERNQFSQIGGSVVQLDDVGSAIKGNILAHGVDKTREAGRFVFNEAEKYNRLVSFQIAWQRAKKQFPDWNPSTTAPTEEIREYMLEKADDFSFNMHQATASAWQKGPVTSLGTQFFAFQTNFLQAAFGKTFTRQERVRLVASQALLYGASGLGLRGSMNWALEQYTEATGQAPSPEVETALVRGMFDSIFGFAGDVMGQEVDTDFAKRAAVAQGIVDFVTGLYDSDSINSKTLLELYGGATLSTLTDVVGSANPVVTAIALAKAETGREALGIMASELNEIAQLASSWSRATKAYYIARYGQIRTRRGTFVDGASPMEAVAAAFGIPLQTETDMYRLINEMQADKAMIRDMATTLSELHVKAWRDIDNGNPEAASAKRRVIEAYMSTIDDPRVRNAVIEEKNRYATSKSVAEDVTVRSIERFGPTGSNQTAAQRLKERQEMEQARQETTQENR